MFYLGSLFYSTCSFARIIIDLTLTMPVLKYKSRVEVRTVIILGRGEDSDRKRALGAFWGTGNVLLLVYSAGYLAMFSL